MMRQVVALIAALSLAGPAVARAGDIAFTVINDSSYDLVSFYVAPSNARSWGQNLLETDKGTFTLRSRSRGTAKIAGGDQYCVHDLKYVLSDGETYYKRDLDICRISSYRIFD
jgi:outer membrane protein assembly factor BamB